MFPVRAARLALGLALAAAGCGHAKPAAPPAARAPAIPMIPEAEAAAANTPHAHRGKPLCQACHVASGALRADTCTRCHAQRHANHPIDVVQRTPAPGIPLLPGGRVACHSCHDPHAPHAAPRAGGSALCMRCHPNY